jgi:ribosomal protein S18 acetylase RimI-like enzyme
MECIQTFKKSAQQQQNHIKGGCRKCILSLEKDILRIGRQCFEEVYWSTIKRVLHKCDIQRSIFVFSEPSYENDTMVHSCNSDRGELQGFILVRDDPYEGARWHIEFVAVDPRFAGKGIGNVMMSALIKAASQACNTSLQDYRLWLHVDEDNYPAQHLYKKYGFTAVQTAPDDFGYMGYIMIAQI